MSHINPIQDGLLWGCSPMEGGGTKMPTIPKNLSHISYNDETWHNYTLPKEAGISIFSPETSKFCYIKK